MGNLQIKPQRVVVQLNDCLMAAFFSVWLDYDKPCILLSPHRGKLSVWSVLALQLTMIKHWNL